MRKVTSPSIRSASSKSASAPAVPPSVFRITYALNLATCPSPPPCADPDVHGARRGKAQARLGCHGDPPLDRLRDDGQIDDGRRDAERDGQPPDHVIGARAIKQEAAEPYAEKSSDLMTEEGETEQGRHPARAEHQGNQRRGRRHGREPQQTHESA